MRTTFLFLLVLLATVPSISVAQTPDSRIQAARERLAEAGLDVGLLDVRIAEGRAKNIPIDRIATAIERRAGALLNAADVLRGIDGNLPQSDLSAGADAIEAGVTASAIQQVARQARAEDRSVAISVLTYLHHERSLPLEVAIRNVSEALRRGPDALRELPAQAAGRGNPGGPPGSQGSGRPPGAGSAGPGQQPGGGPPAGVPGPENRRGRGPDGAGPPGQTGRPDNPGQTP